LKRETHEEEKNNQKGGARARGKRRETRGFTLLPKLARMTMFQVREREVFSLLLNRSVDSQTPYRKTTVTIINNNFFFKKNGVNKKAWVGVG
jgi:hypothetical protein